MNEEPKSSDLPSKPRKADTALNETEYLRQIADHLRSIRAMLSFFTFIIVLAIILQIFGFVGLMMGP